MSTVTEPRVYSVRVAAQLADVHEWTLSEEIRKHGTAAGVPVVRIGRRILIPKEAFDRVLAGQVKGDCEDVHVA